MMSSPIDIIAGARPNFMKIAPIVRALDARRAGGCNLRYRLVHTGQHYDAKMSGDFFEQLGIPAPDVNLEAGGGTQAEQTANIMVRYERLLSSTRPWMCMVVGDVTSTMACAIAAQKMWVPVAHVEAGIRSGDWGMPEEINRIVTDSITNHFFTTTEAAGATLRNTGVADDRIHFVGNTMIDSLLSNRNRFQAPDFWERAGLVAGDYLVATLHRPSNVDDPEKLKALLHAISAGARGRSVVFPVHPRTAKALAAIGPLPDGVLPVDPQPYLEFNYLVEHALGVVTDSGGVTEETTVLGIPCMTLRTTTERPETVTMGTNELLGVDPAAIQPALARLLDGKWKKGTVPPLWDGHAAERIVEVLARLQPTN